MILTPALSAAIQQHAQAEYPKECCGVVVNEQYVPLRNAHKTPKTHFKIDLKDLEGLDYTAIVHSHPDGHDAPSKADMAAQRADGRPWIIVKVTEQGCKAPFILGGPPEPLIGRKFRHGVNDCYSLIQDWFEAQGQRALTPEVPRDWEWWNQGESHYTDHYQLAGWERTATPSVGAMAFMQTAGSPVINHAGVLLPDGWLLHHPERRLSQRESVQQWLPSIKMWIQHPDFVFRAP